MQGTVLCVCVSARVCGWMERGLLTALDPTAEEGPHDLLSSVQSIMCERPSLWVAAWVWASEGPWQAAKQDGNRVHCGAKESLGARSGTEPTASCHLLIMMSSFSWNGRGAGDARLAIANSASLFLCLTVKASSLVCHRALWLRSRNRPWLFSHYNSI